jgi:hypothetical protein
MRFSESDDDEFAGLLPASIGANRLRAPRIEMAEKPTERTSKERRPCVIVRNKPGVSSLGANK